MKKFAFISIMTLVFLLAAGSWHFERQKKADQAATRAEKKSRTGKKAAKPTPAGREEGGADKPAQSSDMDYTFFEVLNDQEMKKFVQIKTDPRYVPAVLQKQAVVEHEEAGGKADEVSVAGNTDSGAADKAATEVIARLNELTTVPASPAPDEKHEASPSARDGATANKGGKVTSPAHPHPAEKPDLAATGLAKVESISSEKISRAITPVSYAPVEKSPAEAAEKNGSRMFTVQINSYQEAARARLISGYLAKKGYSPHMVEVNSSPQSGWYRLMLGKYPSYETAHAVARRVKMEEGLDSVVVLLPR